jgi:Fe-S-cluster-containing dehydrogenase component
MSYIITSQCIGCRRCESICPTRAITQNEQFYQIDPERCNDCVDAYAVPQCWAACPTHGGCIPNMAILPRSASTNGDYWERWFNTYNLLVYRLKANQPSEYWQHWFDRYSQALTRQLHTPTSVGVSA